MNPWWNDDTAGVLIVTLGFVALGLIALAAFAIKLRADHRCQVLKATREQQQRESERHDRERAIRERP